MSRGIVISNNYDFKFAPITGKDPLYFGYVLECTHSKPIDVDCGNGDFTYYPVDTPIYWTPGSYLGVKLSEKDSDKYKKINGET